MAAPPYGRISSSLYDTIGRCMETPGYRAAIISSRHERRVETRRVTIDMALNAGATISQPANGHRNQIVFANKSTIDFMLSDRPEQAHGHEWHEVDTNQPEFLSRARL